MAEGYRAGTVYIDVEPDTRGFYREVKAMLERLDDHTIDLDANLDAAGVRAQLERLQRSGGTIDFDARINVRAFDKVHRQLAELASSTDIDVDVDTSDFDKSLNEAMSRQRARVRQLGEEQKRTWREGWRYLDENTAKHKALGDSILANQVEYAKLGKAIDAAAKHRDSFKRRSDEYRAASDEVKRLRKEYTKLGRSIAKQKKELASTEEERRRYLRDHESKLSKINAEYDKQAKILKDMPVKAHNKQLKELASNLFKAEGNVDALRRAMSRVQFVDMKSQVKDLDVLTKRVGDLQRRLLAVKDSPEQTVKFRTELDGSGLREDLARLQRDVQVEVRVNAQQAAIDRLRRELRELEHTRVDIPVDIKTDFENAIAEHRRLIEQIRRNPDLDWEVKSNVDIDETNARRKLRDLQDDYKTLDMDVDLETALARAHLAYFTRPRTVDIFAKFHGTDLGKILGGMTAGATGLQGVQNQFQNLVNLFDRLDKVVPKVALIGTVLSDIGAGAINLAGTVGGLGKSIVSMSKAAYAAPAALAGMGLAYSSLRMIIGEKGEAWTENINLAGTAMEGLGEKVQDAFYGKAAPAFKEFANTVGGVVVPQMRTLAEHEARIFTGMLDMVTASNKVGQLGRVFTHVNDSLTLLTPGVESVVKAFLNLSDVGGTYLAQFSNWLSRNMEWFSTWAQTVQADSSTVDRAMAQVKEQAGYLADSFFSLKGVVKGVFGALAQNQNGLERFAANLKKAETAVNSISFQDTMNAWVRGAQDAQHGMRDAFNQIGDAANTMRSDVAGAMGNFGELTGNVVGDVSNLLSRVSPALNRFSGGVKDGLSTISRSLADVSPMFSQLIDMAGELSRTFGGTFAATLKAAAPSITAIAKATGTVAEAFNKLPDSIKGALGLWMTFGRAGTSALTSLKTGMLENIQNTLQYRRTLADLGLSAGDAGISFGRLVQAQVRMRNGNISGVLSENATNMVVLGRSTSEAATGMGVMAGKVGGFKGKISGIAGAAKSAGTALLGAFGGVPGLAITAGIGLATTAFASYSQHVTDAQTRQENLNRALNATPGALAKQAQSLDELKNRLNNLQQATADNLSGQKYDFWDTFTGKYSGAFKTAQESIEALGVSTNDVAKAAMGSSQQYDAFVKKLNSAKEPYKANVALGKNMADHLNLLNTEAAGNAKRYNELSGAAQNVVKSMQENRDAVKGNLEVMAVNKGYTADYVDQLLDLKQTLPGIAEGLLDESVKSERLASIKTTLANATSRQTSAWVQAQSAGSSYYRTLGQMPQMLADVNAQVQEGHSSWKNLKEGFDLTTESGRTASDALSTLASNANSYIDAMVARGDSFDTVNGKYSEIRKNLEETARNAGVAEGDVSAFVDTLLGTPESVKTKIEVQSLQAKTELANVIDSMQYLFPAGSREQVRQILLNSVWQGKLDAQGLSNMVKELTENDKTVIINSNADQAVLVTGQIKDTLDQLGSNATDVFINAKTQGKSDVDAMNDVVNALRGTDEEVKLNGATTGQELLDRMKRTIEQTPTESTKTMHGVTTGQDELDKAKWTIEQTPVDSTKTMHGETTGQGQLDSMEDTFANTNDKTATLTGVGVDKGLSSLSNTWHGIQDKSAKVDATTTGTEGVSALGNEIIRVPTDKKNKTIAEVLGTGDINNLNDSIWKVPTQWNNRTAASVTGTKDVNRMESSVRSVPTQWNPRVSAAVFGRDAVSGLNSSIRGLNGKVVSVGANVFGTGDVNGLVSAISGVVSKTVNVIANVIKGAGSATGGRIHGPGTGTSDSIPMWLSNNEHVIRAAAVEKLDRTVGPNFLNVLNRTGDVNKALANANNSYLKSARSLADGAYANGGRVRDALANRQTVMVNTPGRTVNQTFNLQTKIVRSDQDLHAAAQIDKSALMRNAMREARI